MRHELAVASGQVKTALVLAGLQAEGETEIVEPAPSRDHTERMLGALGAPVERVDDRTLRVRAGAPEPFELDGARRPVVGRVLRGRGDDRARLGDRARGREPQPGRIEYVDVLREMGARIEVDGDRDPGRRAGRAPSRSRPHRCTASRSRAREAIIDELPVLAVAAAFAEGVTTIRDAAELAVKETNRIGALEQELTQLGIGVEARPDGLVVRGGDAVGRDARRATATTASRCAARSPGSRPQARRRCGAGPRSRSRTRGSRPTSRRLLEDA